ncbi:chitooligosaccharide deacetylase [Spizellomyces punctatus DAOM BR117]|uniref:Chitooligosaccharide deacetylase n=1 Tax=Spizellomyces punctatus (strain DAOM BR117) TaxID=645134 RepID=A0A0L0HK07_SPIPD|nr:chitooligosaccharide deacetylase [Spizellomyces punctatus DAOM BR117]KND01796.1 chitooligosaccharide deacetylase [Spizellomyces punctatus DAOM BR117]|eukprot:XP_016609835.1 chitooligosaccharide deacetylase [Spizellomyces punctatus DAOM BR117]
MTAIVSHGCELGNHLMFDHASVKLPPAIFEKQLLQVDTLLRKYDNLALSPPRRRKSVAIVDSTVPSGDLPSIPSPTADASRSEPVQLEAPVKYRWFRPGSGWFNSAMLATVEKHGYRTALGCVYPHDPHISNARLNAWHVLRGVHPGAIIVLHDCRSWTIDTLKILLPELRKRGYAVRTLTEVYRSRQVNDGCI